MLLPFLGAGLVALLPAVSSADNLTIETASQYVVGQGWHTFSSSTEGRFYKFGMVMGRSYCAETSSADFNTDAVDTQMSFLVTGGSPLLVNDDNPFEPSAALGPGPSRICFIAPPELPIAFLEVIDHVGSGIPRRFRVSDTSLWAPWFFTGNGFEAFILIRNTTMDPLTVAVSLNQPSGNQNVATQFATIPRNGSLNYQLSAPPFSLTSASGTVQISHEGAPGAIVAVVTSLNFATGVSFDVSASPRQDFRQ